MGTPSDYGDMGMYVSCLWSGHGLAH